MALKYRLIEKEMKIGKKAGQKLSFAQQVTGGYLSFENLCATISDGSTVSSADVKAVFDRMQRVFERYLTDGYIIDCGELGSFRPTFGSAGVENPRDFRQQKHLRKARVRYLPKKKYNVLRSVPYQRVELVNGVLMTALPKTDQCAAVGESKKDNSSPSAKPKVDAGTSSSGAGGL